MEDEWGKNEELMDYWWIYSLKDEAKEKARRMPGFWLFMR